LNPVLSLETQFKEAWRAHSSEPWEKALGWVRELLRSVDLPHDREFLRRRPGQVSIGQAQRVLIALALIHRPKVLIADEPTSALDVVTHKEVLTLFQRLNRELGTAILCISHDLLSVASFCHRVAILHEGGVIENGPPAEVFSRPQHVYTRKLVDSLPNPSWLSNISA
jgi:ABC-type dipeptide/oligopeptide/nickel transport system ATPase component